MKIEWTRSVIIVVSFCVVAIVGVSFAGYVYYLNPTLEQKQKLEADLEAQQEVIANRQDTEIDTTTEMQRMLPVGSNFDALLVELEELETRSNGQIMNISVTSSNAVAAQSNTTNPNNQENTEEALSANVETVTYLMNVTAANFTSMHQFLNRLMEMDRLVEINSLQFNQQMGDIFDFNFEFTTFFSPNLLDLQEEAPDYNFKQPANKNNPF